MSEDLLFNILSRLTNILTTEISSKKAGDIFVTEFVFSSALRKVDEADIESDGEWYAYGIMGTFVFAKGVTISEFFKLYDQDRVEFIEQEESDIILGKSFHIKAR